MSGFDPIFDAAGTGTRAGPVPAPGAIDGLTYFLRADGTWAIPASVPPIPPPPPPGPDLNQWACNLAGWLIYDGVYAITKTAINGVGLPIIGDAISIVVDGLLVAFWPELIALDAALATAIGDYISTWITGHVADFASALLDPVIWAKAHCYVYGLIEGNPTALNVALGAASAAAMVALGIPSQVAGGVALLLQSFGFHTFADVPLSAFVRDYDCTNCSITHESDGGIVTGIASDLSVTDGTTTVPVVHALHFVDATVSGTPPTATITPSNATSSAVGVSRPDNSTVGVTAGVLSVLATPAVTNFYSTVGTGKKFLLGSAPAGWQNVGFDDSAWTAPVLETGGGPLPGITGAQRITSNDGNVSITASFLFRLAFTLPAGTVLSAVSTVLEDNISSVWINGTLISTYTRVVGDTSAPAAISFDPTLLGTNNVLAIQITNGFAGLGANPMSVEYLLAITQASDGALAVEHGGAAVGSRRAINLTDGGGVTWTVADNSTLSRVDISAAAVGFANPMSAAADLIVGGTAGAAARLPKGSDGQVLTVDPATHLLIWATPSSPGTGTVTDVGSSAPITSTGGATPVIGLTTPLVPTYGGTGHDLSAAIDGQIPIASTSDHKFTAATLTAGAGIAITNSAGGISISASGTGAGGTAMTQLAIVTVAGVASSVTISSIPAGYSHLKVIYLARTTTLLTGWDTVTLKLNNDNSAVYDWNQLAILSTVGAAETIGDTSYGLGEVLQDSVGVGLWTMGEVMIPFYAQTSTFKVVQSWESGDRHVGANTNRALLRWGTWRNTAAVTSLVFTTLAGNWKVGTTFSVYGIA